MRHHSSRDHVQYILIIIIFHTYNNYSITMTESVKTRSAQEYWKKFTFISFVLDFNFLIIDNYCNILYTTDLDWNTHSTQRQWRFFVDNLMFHIYTATATEKGVTSRTLHIDQPAISLKSWRWIGLRVFISSPVAIHCMSSVYYTMYVDPLRWRKYLHCFA